MWSTPRSISTALMRAWGSRSDTFVSDEPMYACYLEFSGADHPGRAAALAAQPREWHAVVEQITGPVPRGHRIWYQKHHAHQLPPGIPLDWLARLENCFLIRDPRLVISSYARLRDDFGPRDLGLEALVRIFDHVRESTGRIPPVLDADDLLRAPAPALRALCAAVGVPYDPAMLRWRTGRRPTDLVEEVSRHWYREVHDSTGFRTPDDDPPAEPWPPGRHRDLYEHCLAHYRKLHAHRIRVARTERAETQGAAT